jgi:two-component system LytT family sensor kinase
VEIIERDAWSTRRAGSGVTAPRPATARWLLAAFIVAAWTLPGLLYSVQIYGVGRASDPNLSFFRAALHALPSWWIWIVLTPLVARIARLVPIGRCQGPRAVAVHLAASLAVGLVVLGFAALWFSLTPIRGERDRSFVEWLWTLTHATTLEGYVFSYWLIVGAVHVIGDERRLRAHEIADARRDALVARSRMQVLARQLQPHFLFNSLNALSTLILKRDTDAALGMLSSLAQFLRATIRVGDVDVQPLRDELDLVSQYLDVEKARLGDRLAVVIDAEDAAGDVPVPVLILQPLVENAVRHGIAAREQGGEIAIQGTRSGDVLRVELVNDGPGLTDDWRERAEERVGLKNTRSRLREAYGGAARLTVEDAGSGRTRVVIEVPARGQPGEVTT